MIVLRRPAPGLWCSSGDGLSQEADETWGSIVEGLQDADTIALLYNMPGADDIPIEMIERFRVGLAYSCIEAAPFLLTDEKFLPLAPSAPAPPGPAGVRTPS